MWEHATGVAVEFCVIIAGLIPIMLGEGSGSEMTQSITASMAAGMIRAPLLSLFVISTVYYLWKQRELSL